MTTTTATKKPAAKPSVRTELVFAKDGSVDEQATLASCAAQLEERRKTASKYDRSLSASMERVFDANPGVALNFSALRSEVVADLRENDDTITITHESVGPIEKALLAFVKANSSKDSSEGKLYTPPSRGKGPGVRRWSDIAENATEDESAELDTSGASNLILAPHNL